MKSCTTIVNGKVSVLNFIFLFIYLFIFLYLGVIGPLTHPHNPLGAPENQPVKPPQHTGEFPSVPPGGSNLGPPPFVRQGPRPTELPVRDKIWFINRFTICMLWF